MTLPSAGIIGMCNYTASYAISISKEGVMCQVGMVLHEFNLGRESRQISEFEASQCYIVRPVTKRERENKPVN